jgi:diacylglycerol kinase (ATP)
LYIYIERELTMINIGIIHNPKAKKLVLDPYFAFVLEYTLGQFGISASPTGEDQLKSILRRFKQYNVPIIAFNGGDGTINFILSALVCIYNEYPKKPLPKLLFLRSGTVNTIPRGCGVKGRPEYILYNAVRKLEEGKPLSTVTRNTIQINGRTGFLWGGGKVANFMRRYYSKDVVSPLHAAKTVIVSIFLALFRPSKFSEEFKSLFAKVYINDDKDPVYDGELSIPFAATIRDVGLGFKPFFLADPEKKQFHFLSFKGFSIWHLIREIPFALFGRPLDTERTLNFPAQKIRLVSPDPIHATFDGDMFPKNEADIKHDQDEYEVEIQLGPQVKIIVI